jgi:hypothetical protein
MSELISTKPTQPLIYRLFRLILAFFIVIIFEVESIAQVEELPLKSYFLEAAIRFISWPEDSSFVHHQRSGSFFTIGYFGNDKFLPYLKQSFIHKQVKNREVKFMAISSPESIDSCDVLFIPDFKKKDLQDILIRTLKKPILTVSDQPDFCANGVILGIVSENRKITCYINTIEAQKSSFNISYHLLQKAKVVKTIEGKK